MSGPGNLGARRRERRDANDGQGHSYGNVDDAGSMSATCDPQIVAAGLGGHAHVE